MGNKIVTMKNWKIKKEETGGLYLSGYCAGHPKLADGTRVHTTNIKEIVPEDNRLDIHTKNTIYQCAYKDCREMHEMPLFKDDAQDKQIRSKIEAAMQNYKNELLDIVKSIGLKENEVCLFVSDMTSYYYYKAYVQKEGKLVECKYSVHTGMFQDSVLFFNKFGSGVDYRFFPYVGGHLSFYTFSGDLIYVYNLGFIDMQVDTPAGKFLIKPGTLEKLCPENKESQLKRSIAMEIDMHSAFDPVIKDGEFTGYKTPGSKNDQKHS